MIEDYYFLCSELGLAKNLLKQALTHYSFYGNENENKANSRLIFSGMFVFKGMLADILYRYYPNTGTQLQHILGNLTRNAYLNLLFDKWNLKKHIRVGNNFKYPTQKHLFVYAIMGAVAQSDEQTRHRFIFRFLICDETSHILNHKSRNNNVLHQVNFKALTTIGQQVSISTIKTEPDLFYTKVITEQGTELSRESSKSYKYSRKKAVKEALCILSALDFERFKNETGYLDRLKDREATRKEERARQLIMKMKEKEAIREKRKAQLMLQRKIRDMERKKAQAEAKKRKAERAARAAAKATQAQKPMSANKRRFLEDKKK